MDMSPPSINSDALSKELKCLTRLTPAIEDRNPSDDTTENRSVSEFDADTTTSAHD